MTRCPRTVRADLTIDECARLLTALDLRHLIVVDDNGVLIGIVSDRDVVAAPLVGPNVAPVSNAMTRIVLSVSPTASIERIIDAFVDNRIDAVPVVDASNT